MIKRRLFLFTNLQSVYMNDLYVEVAPFLPLKRKGRQAYTYALTQKQKDKVGVGSVVTVSVGRRYVRGVVVSTHSKKVPYKTKNITKVHGIDLSEKQFDLGNWIAMVMQGGLGFTMRLFMPPGVKAAKEIGSGAVFDAGSKSSEKIAASVSKGFFSVVEKDSEKRREIVSAAVNRFVRKGSQALIVVPEKTMLELGPGVFYSADMNKPQATKIWEELKNGKPLAIRGTQKALFLPFEKLGLIVVEEEQFFSHKLWDQYPKLHNKEGVKKLAEIHDCPVLYVSSFHSMENYHHINAGGIKSILDNSVDIKANIAAFSFEDKLKKYAVPSQLIKRVRSWARDGERVLFFYNRTDNERIATVLKANLREKLFRKCNIETAKVFARADKEGYDRVVWMFPEKMASFPDYRSVERTLITMGRLKLLLKNQRRKVHVVTRREEFVEGLFRSREKVYDRELKLRKKLLLPPFGDQVKVKISDKNAKKAQQKAEKVLGDINDKMNDFAKEKHTEVIVRGPYNDPGDKKIRYILLRGNLPVLINLYDGLDIDYADLTPEKVI